MDTSSGRQVVLLRCGKCEDPIGVWAVTPKTKGASIRRVIIGCGHCGHGLKVRSSSVFNGEIVEFKIHEL